MDWQNHYYRTSRVNLLELPTTFHLLPTVFTLAAMDELPGRRCPGEGCSRAALTYLVAKNRSAERNYPVELKYSAGGKHLAADTD